MSTENIRRDSTSHVAVPSLWRHIGQDPSGPREVIWPGWITLDDVSLDDEDDIVDDSRNLADAATRTEQLVFADYSFGGVGDCGRELNALDLGDDWWYIVSDARSCEEGEGYDLVGIVPKEKQAEGFAEAQRQWIEGCLDPIFPTDLEAYDLDEPWFRRELVAHCDAEFYETLATYVGFPGAYDTDLDAAAAREKWYQTVRVKAGSRRASMPPDLGKPLVESERFNRWLEGVHVYWADTSEELTSDEAQRLRWLCQYLALKEAA
jgi:hypothetical protein